jgi:hypothetical protein
MKRGMSLSKFNRIVAVALFFHVMVSFVFIAVPTFLASSLISKVYKRYLLPGPFFSEDRISITQASLISWKVNNQWSTPVAATLNTYRDFFSTGNSTGIYQARLERTLVSQYQYELDENRKGERMNILKKYYKNCYVPKEADSIQLMILQKESKNFHVHMDTLTKIRF